MKRIWVVTPCYNEEENVHELHQRIREVFEKLGSRYQYTHLFIDNASSDGTVREIRRLAAQDPEHVKAIVNLRNFGHIRSPYYGLLQAECDAAILMASDLQDPPELIPELLQQWEEGKPVVLLVKNQAEESPLFFAVRSTFYSFINRLSEIRLIKNATGSGLYDQQVIRTLRTIETSYPYFRGLVADLGYEIGTVKFKQPNRKRGLSSNNFYTLYDMAMTGITHHSKIPLRVAAFFGFTLGSLSLLVAIGYLVAKLLWWNSFELGRAPILVGMFFFASIQLFFIGIIGEYIGAIYTQVLRRPLVIERERIGFSTEANHP